ncbi:MAG: hypothetical protein HY738_05625 [Bacteroidia bacterium]|nr:hypothetical protein [Bacteroidia bacterium]
MKTRINRKSKKNCRKKKSTIQEKQSRRIKRQEFEGRQLALQILLTLRRHFPTLLDDLSCLKDYRKSPKYDVKELLMACISMFLFKRSSRNAMNNSSRKGLFQKNYQKIFGVNLPHMDTVDVFLETLAAEDLEQIKQRMIQCLIEKKALQKFKISGHYVVAVDGTVIGAYDYEPYPECPFKESKTGKKTWLVPVLEAKIVCSNGLSLSIATEWISNTGNYEKQDCEQKAFTRLAEKLKQSCPRLPICIAADGLYPNQTTFEICRNNNWNYIITLKDGNLKTVWEDINFELLIAKDKPLEEIIKYSATEKIIHYYRFINGLTYHGFVLNWIECVERVIKKDKEEKCRFVHITNMKIDKNNVASLSYHGRLRWNIENEGFNSQKNQGYNLEHKYARSNFNARKNYYQCLQIAHMINQLAVKVKSFNLLIDAKDTLLSLWECLLSFMMVGFVHQPVLDRLYQSNCQMRY